MKRLSMLILNKEVKMKRLSMLTLTMTFILAFILGSQHIYAEQSHVDPANIKVVSAEEPLTVDGVLDENDWARRFDYLVFNSKMLTGDVEYAPTNGFQVTGEYSDTTTTRVKFLHDGLDLYISLDSDDKSVCKFGTSWEGDGLFMKIKDASGTAVEFKLYWNLSGDDPEIAFEAPGSYPDAGSGAAVKNSGTIVNDTTQVDSGYTAEMVIHLDELGYTEPLTDVELMISIFDPDNYSGDDDPYKSTGSYYKQWWGSEWGSEFRTLTLADPKIKTAYKTETEINLDGKLNEDFWASAESVSIGADAKTNTGGFYMQWGDSLNDYTDHSEAVVKFIHKDTDLYIGVESNDSSVCKWSPGWEADGLFLWMTNYGTIPAANERMEIKAMYFTGEEGDSIEFQTSATVPTGAAEGASYEPEGTVTHTGTNGADAGYSIETVVHTADFGYMVGDTVRLSCVIWDVDYSSADVYDESDSDYGLNWWGTQWVDPNFEKYFMYRGVVLSNETDIANKGVQIAKKMKLYSNYPNPFNPTTNIEFTLPHRSQVRLDVYNLLGNRVKTLVNDKLNQGRHSVIWNGKTESGQLASSGIYFYKLSSGQNCKIKKMILAK